MVDILKSFFIRFKKIPNKLLILIIITSVILNTTGLIPNTFFHQNEPGLIGPSDQLFKNIIIESDFDPNVPPDAFKYASILFYKQAFTRGGTLYLIYQINKLTGFDFGKPQAFEATFSEFISEDGVMFFESYLLFMARFWGVLFGTGSVFLIFLICLKLFKNRSIALFSAAALAVMPLHVRNSHYALADMPQVFFFTLSFLTSLLMYEKKTAKSYLLAGFTVGLATSLKYFPLPILPFMIFHFFTDKKNWLSRNFFSSLLAIFVGYWAGMPYLFVHFNEIIGFIPYALTWYGPDKLHSQASSFEKLLPHNLHAYHLKFLWKDAMLPLPFIASIAGLIYGLKRFTRPTLLVLIIPLLNSIFIFFYVKQIYEQLSMPSLPFLAIFVGLFAYAITSYKQHKIFLVLAVVSLLYIPSFVASAQASLACRTEINEFQARNWIRENIPLKTNFAYQPGARLPSELDINWIKSEFKEDFSLSEIQDTNATYLMTLKGYYGVNISWSDDTFFPPQIVTDNQYVQLAINEYNSSTQVVKNFIKPYMCISEEINIYRIPPKLIQATNTVLKFNFDDEKDFSKFNLIDNSGEAKLSLVKEVGHEKEGAIRYEYLTDKYNYWRNQYYFFYQTPVRSDLLPAQSGKKYTLSGWTKFEKPAKNKDMFLRVDFFDGPNKPPIRTSLSSRAKPMVGWQKLDITVLAPETAKFVTIGFEGLAPEKSGSFLIDDLTLYAD